jgi:hypothetical protein
MPQIRAAYLNSVNNILSQLALLIKRILMTSIDEHENVARMPPRYFIYRIFSYGSSTVIGCALNYSANRRYEAPGARALKSVPLIITSNIYSNAILGDSRRSIAIFLSLPWESFRTNHFSGCVPFI